MLTTPGLIAETTPDVLTVAIAGLLVLQMPPGGVAVIAVVVPTHSELLPVMVAEVLTVMSRKALQPPDV